MYCTYTATPGTLPRRYHCDIRTLTHIKIYIGAYLYALRDGNIYTSVQSSHVRT